MDILEGRSERGPCPESLDQRLWKLLSLSSHLWVSDSFRVQKRIIYGSGVPGSLHTLFILTAPIWRRKPRHRGISSFA